MFMNPKAVGLAAIVSLVLTTPAMASRSIDDIYRVFIDRPLDRDEISALYVKDIIHVGRAGNELLRGRSDFMGTAIDPIMQSLHNGDFKISMRFYIVRRLQTPEMANDVGYVYSQVEARDGTVVEGVQKFSWVFLKVGQDWKVATDFDATPANLAALEGLELFERVIE